MINQVNTVLLRRNLLRHVFRQYHNEPEPSNILYPLESRKVLKVAGAEAAAFLQGLVTNDMRHLEDGANSMYAMFLNNKGRVLYDTLIHKYKDGFMVECDKSILSLLKRHLQLYKLKRKVDIEDISHNFKLFAFVAPPSKWLSSDVGYNINIYKDPRLPDLGYRILTGVAMTTETVVDLIGNDVIIEKNEKGYNLLRYKLGVSEGALDLPPGSSFPLEANCDYLHGVSFHKGCYIGQELTARVHHTGVIRKRIMPLKFCENVANLELGSVISASNNPKSNIGKLRGFMGTCGIGLVRIKEAMEAQEFNIAEYTVKINKPAWWPIEAPKEKATVAKSEINLE